MLWRPVRAGYGTLLEVQRDWSLDDVVDAHAVLDTAETAEIRGLK